MTKFLKDYEKFVTGLMSPESLVDFRSKINVAGLGLAGEGGEAAEIAKKVLFHGKEWNEEVRQRFLKELGDVAFYLAFAAVHVCDSSIEEVISLNMAKLTERFPSGKFSVQDAAQKKDAQKSPEKTHYLTQKLLVENEYDQTVKRFVKLYGDRIPMVSIGINERKHGDTLVVMISKKTDSVKSIIKETEGFFSGFPLKFEVTGKINPANLQVKVAAAEHRREVKRRKTRRQV